MNRTLNSVLALAFLAIAAVSFWMMVSEESLHYLPRITMWLVTFVVATIALFTVLMHRPPGRIQHAAKLIVDWL